MVWGMLTNRERAARSRGKMFGVYRSQAIPGAITCIDVRVDSHGTFTAEYLSTWYEAKTYADLRAKLDAVVRERGSLTWNYFIDIEDVDFEDNDYRSASGVFGRRQKINITVDYNLVGVSNVLDGQGLSNNYRLVRRAEVLEDGTIKDSDRDPDMEMVSSEPDTRIPFTLERWRKLERITEAATELGRRLRDALNMGGTKAVAGFLDSPASPLPLALAPPVPIPKKRKPR